MFRKEDNDRHLADQGRSLICESSVANLGSIPRVRGADEGAGDVLVGIQDTEGDISVTPSPRTAGDEAGNHVGFSIHMSDGVANASHFDIGDASRGLCVWTEDSPGTADNWYFIMPNIQGTHADEATTTLTAMESQETSGNLG
jgi:hypothetical protein